MLNITKAFVGSFLFQQQRKLQFRHSQVQNMTSPSMSTSATSSHSTKEIAVFGGGLVGSSVAQSLADAELKVTLIDPKNYFENNMGTVRTQVNPAFLHQTTMETADWGAKLKHLQGSVTEIKDNSAVVQTSQGPQEIKFDYAVLAMGSSYDAFKAQAPTLQERMNGLKHRAEVIKQAKHILIVGGGPVGVESLGEILHAYPDKQVTLVHSLSRLLNLAPGAHELAMGHITKHKNVRLILDDRVEVKVDGNDRVDMRTYVTRKGQRIDADFVIFAAGMRLNNTALQTHLRDTLSSNGSVKVEPTLQVSGHPSLFAVGDLADLGFGKNAANYKEHPQTVTSNIVSLIANQKPLATHATTARLNWPGITTFGPDASINVLPLFCNIVVRNTWKYFAGMKTRLMTTLPKHEQN